jgi:outer membrane protein OmpA-like peptidoglycan-associated protein
MKRPFLLLLALIFAPALAVASERVSLSLRADPAYFSPNGDGFQDQLFLYPVMTGHSEVSRWRVDVKSSRKRVARLMGAGFPALVMWDGLDKKGQPSADGSYVAIFKLWGSNGDATAQTSIVLDTKPPIVNVEVSTLNLTSAAPGTRALFMPHAIDESPLDRWQLQLLDDTGRTVQLFWSTGPVTDIAWNGIDRASGALVPQGRYHAAFEAWDKAGNDSAPSTADFDVNVSARESVQQAVRKIQVVETPAGLIVPLSSAQLFGRNVRRPVLTPKGTEYLRELSILVNAYPDATVHIDGFARGSGKLSADRDRASLYAWGVYSYLVKQGNVKASRISVRGRGRGEKSRWGHQLPSIQNGVEVVLDGRDQW